MGLEAALVELLDAPPGASVEGLRRLSGGASRETWSFDLRVGERVRPLILQRQRPGTVGAATMATEAVLLRAAADQGVPVPEVVASDPGDHLGASAMVVARIDGETIPRRILRDDQWSTARARLCEQAADALARIHRIDPAAVPGLADTDQLDQLRQLLDGLGVAHPAFELGLRWLAAHRPPPRRATVVHGDFRLGNLLVDPGGLAAVLDWELSHVGDPVEDLGWYCVRAWRFGAPLPAGGTATREELLERYAAAGGEEVGLDELRWWEALGTLKWGVICIVQAQAHLSGAARSVELATIGRRVCENEWDLLGLLPGDPLLAEAPAEPDGPVAGLHGRPTAAELVEAVREWIEGDVRSTTEGRVAFHARVAVNALAMVERELALGPAAEHAHRERLRALGADDDRGLAERIRSGALDDRYDEVRAAVAGSVRDKLRVANPRHLEPDG